ncbi:MAG: hypothetical protein Q8P05_01150 [Candidatus Diapherotrites archaeon]|nr:hypothetical protein [Candidatus Diapherotrites archaeon]MDZ4256081.1 hypothetical protein [archaeon]
MQTGKSTPGASNDPSLFVEFFGDYPFIRVLDFLLENDAFDYSKKDICRYSNVSWNTLDTFWNQLEREQIVAPTRKVGKAMLYKLNSRNPIVEQLRALDQRLMRASLQKVDPKKIKPIAADSD